MKEGEKKQKKSKEEVKIKRNDENKDSVEKRRSQKIKISFF